MIVSKLTSKAQTTIPQPVRTALNLQPGDEIVYEIVDERVILTKARRGSRKLDDPFRTFEEWGGEADTRAYADL
jgi:antitoxin PrlF